MTSVRQAQKSDVRQVLPGGPHGNLCACVEIKFVEDVADVGSHRPFGNDQLGGDLTVGASLRNELGDLHLARRKPAYCTRRGIAPGQRQFRKLPARAPE